MRTLGMWAAGIGGYSVAAGAFGAHGLRSQLTPDMLAVFETGVRYALVHAVALLSLVLGGEMLGGARRAVGFLWIAGVLIFTGSLTILALSGHRIWGAVTPVGGVCLITGWVRLVWAFGSLKESA